VPRTLVFFTSPERFSFGTGMKPEKSKDATKLLNHMIGDNQELRDMVAEELLNVRVARMIVDARQKAGLTQKKLAERVGTTQSVIARLEDADYEGHSLSMLQRIAEALGKSVEIRFGNPDRPRAVHHANARPRHGAHGGQAAGARLRITARRKRGSC
jgi:transcriptional regulator with XRE-family HTH domain